MTPKFPPPPPIFDDPTVSGEFNINLPTLKVPWHTRALPLSLESFLSDKEVLGVCPRGKWCVLGTAVSASIKGPASGSY